MYQSSRFASVSLSDHVDARIDEEINKLNKSVNLLRGNIVDLASVAKHNTLNVCKITKSMAEVDFH